ncbi:MAG TPA: hypothetical protein VM204_09305, partial [Gaiellaceae bacterium]|nr:hypothetical protein [Gaiellaceae bacterium]
MARVMRAALRLRTEVVSLVEPPRRAGQHLLDIEVPGFGLVTLLAEPLGSGRPEGHPLSVRPVTRVQMAELFALVERLDAPSQTEPPPPPPDDDDDGFDGPGDDTMVDAEPPRVVLPAGHGRLDPLAAAGATQPPGAGPIGDRAPSSAQGRAPSSAGVRSTPPRASSRPADPRVGRVLAGRYQIEA